jgi:hypothetical protein
MSRVAKATFTVQSWDEKPYAEFEGGRKLTRALVVKSLHGDIEGEGRLEYLMCYNEDGTAGYVGLERVVATIDGRSGSFVLRDVGADTPAGTKSQLEIIPGSGTGGLKGITGTGSFHLSGHAEEYPFTLEYSLE